MPGGHGLQCILNHFILKLVQNELKILVTSYWGWNAKASGNRSGDHDSFGCALFIIHQVSELWLKLMHHQLVEVRRFLQQDEFGPAMKNLDRIKAIQRQLIAAWETLLTMTPADYMTFRKALGNLPSTAAESEILNSCQKGALQGVPVHSGSWRISQPDHHSNS